MRETRGRHKNNREAREEAHRQLILQRHHPRLWPPPGARLQSPKRTCEYVSRSCKLCDEARPPAGLAAAVTDRGLELGRELPGRTLWPTRAIEQAGQGRSRFSARFEPPVPPTMRRRRRHAAAASFPPRSRRPARSGQPGRASPHGETTSEPSFEWFLARHTLEGGPDRTLSRSLTSVGTSPSGATRPFAEVADARRLLPRSGSTSRWARASERACLPGARRGRRLAVCWEGGDAVRAVGRRFDRLSSGGRGAVRRRLRSGLRHPRRAWLDHRAHAGGIRLVWRPSRG